MTLAFARMPLLVFVVVPLFLGLFKTKQTSRASHTATHADNNTFAILHGDIDGHPLFASIDTSLRDYKSKDRFPWFLSISVPLKNPNKDGLTTAQEAEQLNEWEDSLEKQIAAECNLVYVGRVTWNGHRELLYYIDQPKPVHLRLKSLIDSHAMRPFTFLCERDEKWEKVSVYFRKHP